MKEKLCKRKAFICFYCQQIEVNVFSAILQGLFFFLLYAQKKKKQKEKAPAAAPELKNRCISLNEKNSLRSNSFSFLTGNTRFFLTLLHGGRGSLLGG